MSCIIERNVLCVLGGASTIPVRLSGERDVVAWLHHFRLR